MKNFYSRMGCAALLAIVTMLTSQKAFADDSNRFVYVTPDSVTLTVDVLSEEAKTVSIYSGSFQKLVETFTVPEKVYRTVIVRDDTTGDSISSANTEYTVKRIGAKAFYHASASTIVIPECIDTIGSMAFCESFSLQKVIVYNRKGMGDVVWAPSDVFSGSVERFLTTAGSTEMRIYENAVACVPFGMHYAYSRGNCWKNFKELIEGTEDETYESAPVFSVGGGEYDQPQTITLTNPNDGGEIYYYITGEDNQSTYWSFTPEVLKYEGPIELGSTGVVVAYVTDGTHRSPVRKESYTINAAALTVAGIMVNAKNQDDVLGDKGSVSVDAKSGALILNNANFDTNEYEAVTGIEIAGGDFTIQLIGENTITAQDKGIDFGYAGGSGSGGNLMIVGEGDNASLTINMNGKGGNGLFAYLANVTLVNCAVTINGGMEGVYFKAGGKGDGALAIMKNASLKVEAQQTALVGVFDLQLGDDISIIAPEGATFVSASDAPESEGNIIVAGEVSPSVTIGTAADEPQEARGIVSTFESGEKHGIIVARETTDELEVNWQTNRGDGQYIPCGQELFPTVLQSRYEITGKIDSIKVTTNTYNCYDGPRCVLAATTSGGKTIGNVEVVSRTVTGTVTPSVNLDGDMLGTDSTYTNSYSYVQEIDSTYIIKPATSIDVDGESILIAVNQTGNPEHEMGGGLLLESITVYCNGEAKTVDWNRYYYNLTVGDVQVSSDNYQDITRDEENDEHFIHGKASYDPETQTLTIENATIGGSGREGGGSPIGIVMDKVDGVAGEDIPLLCIRLVGKNSLTGGEAALGIEQSYKIYSEDGTGVLQYVGYEPVYSETHHSGGNYQCDSLIVSNATVHATSVSVKNLEMHDDATLTFWGGDFRATSHVFDDNIGIVSPADVAISAETGWIEGENLFDDDDNPVLVTIGPIEPVEIEPVIEETTVDFGDDYFFDAENNPIDLNNTVVDNNIYVCIDNTTDEENPAGYYDADEQCIVINETTSGEQMETVVSNEPGTQGVTGNYTGLIIQVPAGQGTVTVQVQTNGDSYVAVQVGDEQPTTEQSSTRSDVPVNYDVTEDTYVYIYATNNSTASGSRAQLLDLRKGPKYAPSAAANSVKIYSIKVSPTVVTGIEQIDETTVDSQKNGVKWYNLQGMPISQPSQKGIYIVNGLKVVVK